MKTTFAFALAAVLAAAPMAGFGAEEKKEGDASAEAAKPTPEQLKARKIVRAKPLYTKFAVAKDLAEKSGLPLVVLAAPDGKATAFFNQKVIRRKEFLKEFAARNFVVVMMKIKPDGRDPKKIDLKPLKEPEEKFLENFAVSASAISRAKAAKEAEPKHTDIKCYPLAVCVDSTCQKELFRLPKYDQEGGFGVWVAQVVDLVRSAGVEPDISPVVQKILDTPDDKKWK